MIHQGSLALPVLAIAGAVAGLRAVTPRLALAIVLLSVAVVLLLYVPVLDPTPGTQYSPVGVTAIAASLLGFIVVAVRSHEPRPADEVKLTARRAPKVPVNATTDETQEE